MPRSVITVLVPVVYLLHVLSSWPLWLWLARSLIGRGSDSLRLVRPEKENTSKRPLLMQQHFDDSIAHQARSIAASSCIVSVVSLLALSCHPTAGQRTRPSVILDCPCETRQDTGLAIKGCSTLLARRTLLQFVHCESHRGNHRYVSVCC